MQPFRIGELVEMPINTRDEVSRWNSEAVARLHGAALLSFSGSPLTILVLKPGFVGAVLARIFEHEFRGF